jgi:uncharacterized protein YecE (DUF72 family)
MGSLVAGSVRNGAARRPRCAAARYDYRYPAEELEAIVDVIEVLSRQARETYLITNNDFRG